jgi:6-phosphogluconolactonase
MVTFALCGCNPSPKTDAGSPETYRFYVGSGSGQQEYSIFLCEFDPAASSLAVVDSFAGATGSGYLAISPDGKSLYATSHAALEGFEGMNSITSFRVDAATGKLSLLNRQSSRGRGTCHVKVDPKGGFVFAANYSSGDAVALPLEEDGRIGNSASLRKGEGSGPMESRQKGPHAHQVVMDPSGTYLLVPDLGTDKVMNYLLNRENGELTPNPGQPFLRMAPGAGPRHLDFHPSGTSLFVLNELDATLTACTFDPETGVMEILNSVQIVADGFDGNRQSAAVRVHPSGNFVYASNRSDTSNVSVFRVQEDGRITRIQIMEPVPYWPRDFNLTPDGKFLLVAGARVDQIVAYRVDEASGMLEPMEGELRLPQPTHILFGP